MLSRLRDKILPLARHETAAALRSPAGLGVAVLCCAVGLALGHGEALSAGLVAHRVGRVGAIMLGFMCLPLLAGAARRDALTNAADAVQSRPHQAHELMAARWLGNLLFLLALLCVVALFAFGAHVATAEAQPPGGGARMTLWALVDALAMGALPLIFLSALGFCIADLLQNVLAAAIIGLFWILVLVGRDYLSRVFDFSLSQNAPAYLLLAAGVVLLGMAVARWRQGLRNARRLNVPALAALCLCSGLVLARHFVLVRHDPPLHHHPVNQEVGSQSIRSGRLPGFWLNDQHGRRVRLAEYAGKTLVLGFWSPARPESVGVLSLLGRVRNEYSPDQVAVIGVCIADDMGTGKRFARDAGLRFPVVTDDGTHWAPEVSESSPLAEAYELTDLPVVFIADGKRRLLVRMASTVGMQLQAVSPQVGRAVRGELPVWQPSAAEQSVADIEAAKKQGNADREDDGDRGGRRDRGRRRGGEDEE